MTIRLELNLQPRKSEWNLRANMNMSEAIWQSYNLAAVPHEVKKENMEDESVESLLEKGEANSPPQAS